MKCCTIKCKRKAIAERIVATTAVPVCREHLWESDNTWKPKISLQKLYPINTK